MKRLELWQNKRPLPLGVEVGEKLKRDPECTACTLGKSDKVRTRCLDGEGDAGGILFVGESPDRNEDATGRPFMGRGGQHLRRLLLKHAPPNVPIAFDNAVRCAPGRSTVTKTHVSRCRPYLSETVDAGFQRIICLGGIAAHAVTGRSVPPFSCRKGYSYLSDGTPVFFLLHPAIGLRNRFIAGWFEEDLQWALTATPQAPDWDAECRMVETGEDAAAAIAATLAEPWASFDVETQGRMWCNDFDVISIAIAPVGTGDTYVWGRDALNTAATAFPLLDWLESDAPKVGQNVKYDQLAVHDAFDIWTGGVVGDTRLMRKLLLPDASGALDNMAELVGMGGLKGETITEMKRIVTTIKRNIKKGVTPLYPGLRKGVSAAIRLGVAPERFMYGIIPEDRLATYNARDAIATTELGDKLFKDLQAEPALWRTWTRTVQPAAEALVRVEAWGVQADEDALRVFDAHLDTAIADAEKMLEQYPDINWNSTKQVRELLFEKIGLPVIRHTKTGAPSTDAKTMRILASKHALPKSLLNYRTMTKLKGTYVDGMWEHIRDDGRIHPNVKLDGAASGRTSCRDPNLQNIPRAKSTEGKMARNVFRASPGCQLIELDYSQLELRVAAMLSGDPLMRQIFDEGVDYHRRTAEMVSELAWNIQPDMVQDEHRTQAKTINFGVLYGMSDPALAGQLGCSVAQAGRVRQAILGKFTTLDKWCRGQLTSTRRSGLTWTMWDGEKARRRPLYRIADADGESRSRAEHGSWNTPVQGTASDFCINSLAECVKWIIGDNVPGVKLVLTVHDSLMFDAREDMVEETVATARAIMTSWPSAGVPLVVDAKVGPSWGNMTDV